MNAPLAQPLLRVASALRSCHANLAQAACWMHPSWTMALLNIDAGQYESWSGMVKHSSPLVRERVSLALCASAGAAAPTLEQLSQPMLRTRPDGETLNPALLDVCPAALGLQILRMRALLFRRAEVRRLIDKRTRALLAEWVGTPIDGLGLDAHLADAPNAATLQAQIGMPPLAALDADALAVEGFLLIQRDCGPPRSAATLPLLRCALQRDLRAPDWLTALSPEIDSTGTARLFRRLRVLLPEWAWLFG